MAELILEPYAARQHWALPGEDPDWHAVLGGYLLALAQACQAAGSPVIGHIKALALFPDGGFFRVSVVDAALPVTLEGGLPPHLASLDLTLNLIVYGLKRDVLRQITAETSAQFAATYQGEVTDQPEPHAHHSHHSHD